MFLWNRTRGSICLRWLLQSYRNVASLRRRAGSLENFLRIFSFSLGFVAARRNSLSPRPHGGEGSASSQSGDYSGSPNWNESRSLSNHMLWLRRNQLNNFLFAFLKIISLLVELDFLLQHRLCRLPVKVSFRRNPFNHSVHIAFMQNPSHAK